MNFFSASFFTWLFKITEADHFWPICTSRSFLSVWALSFTLLPSSLPVQRREYIYLSTFPGFEMLVLWANVRTDQERVHPGCWARFTRSKKEVSIRSLWRKRSALFILKPNFWTWSAHVRHISFPYSSPGMFSIKLYDGTHSKQK